MLPVSCRCGKLFCVLSDIRRFKRPTPSQATIYRKSSKNSYSQATIEKTTISGASHGSSRSPFHRLLISRVYNPTLFRLLGC